MKVSAILLAAGQSNRMGVLKGLLPWQGKTLFEHQLHVLEASNLSQIIVVTGFESKRYLQLATNYSVTLATNTEYLKGKCSSILRGIDFVSIETEAILIAAVDQPTDTSIIHQLIEALQTSNCFIAVPVNAGKRGHPVLFSANIMKDLQSIREETKGLRYLFQKYYTKVIEVPINHSLINLNINTPSDYQNALDLNNVK
ncbi:nucleotidyltransferase family protein [Cytobacillus praedii]|uniref:Nucleotidyltransferase family protein n=1 Tax=Cytobacillus praedii TaxID=1742358 RepID=A0A4R1AYS5_9BACI|nr:nucleotidyltransferase family protein [Cytobacillus praedii]TCJ03532.1 nucleotidyltransferase family protein [Cytobacillus praedii]